jgi:hypothetical protein
MWQKWHWLLIKYLLTQWYKLNWNVTNVISHSNHHFICINILNKFMESHQFCQKLTNAFCAQPLLQGFALFHIWPQLLEKIFLNTISCTISDLHNANFCQKKTQLIWILAENGLNSDIKSEPLKTIQISIQFFCLIKSSILILFFYLHFTWLCGSWHHKRILKNQPFWKYESCFPSEVWKLTSVRKKHNLPLKIHWSKHCLLDVLWSQKISSKYITDHIWWEQ